MNATTASRNACDSWASWSIDSASPWLVRTGAPRSARTSLASWLPATQSAVPASAIAITCRSTPGVSGPRSTRSPTNTAVRPSGWAVPSHPRLREEGVELRRAAVDVTDEVVARLHRTSVLNEAPGKKSVPRP